MCIGSHGNTKCTGETEIGELEIIVLVNEQILGLEITMEDSMAMAVQEAGVELVEEFLLSNLSQPSLEP